LKFECDCCLTQNAFLGGFQNRSSFGPNSTRPAQILPYACVPDPNRSESSREGRASVCNRAVLTGWEILTLGLQNRDFSEWRHRIAPKPVL
jgi:hypothetical protein